MKITFTPRDCSSASPDATAAGAAPAQAGGITLNSLHLGAPAGGGGGEVDASASLWVCEGGGGGGVRRGVGGEGA